MSARNDLAKKCKPTFDQYEADGGIPVWALRQYLREQGPASGLNNEAVNDLLTKVDINHNDRVDYQEFLQMLRRDELELENPRETSGMQRMVEFAAKSVVPRSKLSTTESKDYLDQYNCKPPPLFIIIISLAEVIVFIVYAVELAKLGEPVTALSGVPLYSPLIYDATRRYEAWRYLTYMLLHSGYVHLIMNLVFQLLIGLPLEMVHKWWRVGLVYILGVIAGSLGHSVTDMTSYLVGASGGCYALLGAHLATIIMNWQEMTYDWKSQPVRFMMSAPVRLVVWILIGSVDLGISIYTRYTADPGGTQVGYAAHLAGLLCGIFVGIPVLRNLDEKPWEKVVFFVSLIVYICCVIFAVCWNGFYPGYPDTDWTPCCPSHEPSNIV